MELNDYINKHIEDITKKSNGYFWGVSYGPTFYIADKSFKVLIEAKAFNKQGDFTRDVTRVMKSYGIDFLASEMRTESNIDDLKRNIEMEANLLFKYNKRKAK